MRIREAFPFCPLQEGPWMSRRKEWADRFRPRLSSLAVNQRESFLFLGYVLGHLEIFSLVRLQ